MGHRRIRLTLFAIALLVGFVVPGAAFSRGQSAALPKLVIAKPEHDFGKVKQGEQVATTFTVENAGTAELVIANVSPACGCTATDFSKKVAPREKGKITLSVNTAGLLGKVSRYADVISNDKEQPNFKLWVHLDVQKAE